MMSWVDGYPIPKWHLLICSSGSIPGMRSCGGASTGRPPGDGAGVRQQRVPAGSGG